MGRLEQELVMRVALLQPELAPRLAQRIAATTPTAQLFDLLHSDAALATAVDQAMLQEMNDENMTGPDVTRSSDRVRPANALADSWLEPRQRNVASVQGGSHRRGRRPMPEDVVEAASPIMARGGSAAKGKGYSAKGLRSSMPANATAARALPDRPTLERPMLARPRLERPGLEQQELEAQDWPTPASRGKGWRAPEAREEGGAEWQELEERPLEWTAPKPRGRGRGGAPICSRRPPRDLADQDEVSELLQRVSAVHPEMAIRIVERIAALGPAAVQDCLLSASVLQRHMSETLIILYNSEADDSMAGEIRRLREACNTGTSVRPVQELPRVREQIVAPRQRSHLEVAASACALQQTELQMDASSAGPEGHGKPRIWGLEDFLEELNLSEYLDDARAWAQTMGAAFLEELIENQEDLGADLEMRPLERKRLQRQGPEVAARLVQRRHACTTDKPPEADLVPMPSGKWR